MTLTAKDAACIVVAALAMVVAYELAAHMFMLSAGFTGMESWSWVIQGLFRMAGVL